MTYPPAWLDSLATDVASCMEVHAEAGPLAYRWRVEDDFWEIWIYLPPGELVGGAADGTLVTPGFSVDVHQLSEVFEEVAELYWQAQAFGPHDHQGQSLSVEGVYEGRHVWLLVLGEAPDDEEPGFTVDLTRRREEP